MGNSYSTLAKEDILLLQQCTHFTVAELEELYRRFERLDRDHSGTLSAEEILGIPEFAMNPLAPRILDLLNIHQQELDFTGFIQLLSVFHPKSTTEEKLRFVFQVYNLAGDGVLKKAELLKVIRMMAGYYLEEEELINIVEQSFSDADLDKDGVIDFEEFFNV